MVKLGIERSELLKYARLLSESGDKINARRIYRFLIHQNGNDTEALTGLSGLVEVDSKESTVASGFEGESKEASRQTIDDVEAKLGHGNLERPERITLMVNAGVLSFKAGKTFQARYYFKQVLQLDPNNSRAHCGLAMVHWKRGRIHDAWLEFMGALDLEISNLTALFGLLHVAQALGRLSLARCYLKRFLEMNPDHSDLWILLAKVDISVGHTNEASKILQRILRRENENHEAKELLEQLSTS